MPLYLNKLEITFIWMPQKYVEDICFTFSEKYTTFQETAPFRL